MRDFNLPADRDTDYSNHPYESPGIDPQEYDAVVPDGGQDDIEDIDDGGAIETLTAPAPEEVEHTLGRRAVAADLPPRRRQITARITASGDPEGHAAQIEARRTPFREAAARRLSERDTSGLSEDELEHIANQIADQMATLQAVEDELGAVSRGEAPLSERTPHEIADDPYMTQAKQLCDLRPFQPGETLEMRAAYIRYVAEVLRVDDAVKLAGPPLRSEYRPGDELADSNAPTQELPITENPATPDAPIDSNHPYFRQAHAKILEGNPNIDSAEAHRLATLHANIRLRGEAMARQASSTEPATSGGEANVLIMELTPAPAAQPGFEGQQRIPTVDPTQFDTDYGSPLARGGAFAQYQAALDGSEVRNIPGVTGLNELAVNSPPEDFEFLLKRMKTGVWPDETPRSQKKGQGPTESTE